MKYKILILILFVCGAIQETKAQQRDFIYLHGYNDNNLCFWSQRGVINTDRGARIDRTFIPSFNTSVGIDGAFNQNLPAVGTNLLNQITRNNTHRDRDIAIGHSMGGIVLRELDRKSRTTGVTGNGISVNGAFYGGMISVCSPHNGMPAGSSLTDGRFDRFGNQGCKELIGDPSRALGLAISSITARAWAQYVGGFIDITGRIVCDYVSNIPLQNVKRNYTDSPLTLADLSDNSNFLNNQQTGLNTYQSPTYKVAIAGNETRPVH